MRLAKVKQSPGDGFEYNERTRGLLHWLKAQVSGECPTCHGTHNKKIYGWNRLQCENCGNTWTIC